MLYLLTFHIFCTVLAVSFLKKDGKRSGSCCKSCFFSLPIRLVQSSAPDPFPSAFFFSQTLNETPQALISLTAFCKCCPMTGGFKIFCLWASSSSHSIISLKMFRVSTSVTLSKIWVGVCGTLLKTLTLFQTKICDFPYPISDLTQNLIPYFRPGSVCVTI